MIKFLSGIICILLHWPKKLTLVCLSFLWWQVFLREREEIFYTYSEPKPLLNRCWIILYFVEFVFWFVGYLFLVIISSFEAIFCSISRHYSSKKVVILHFRKASKRVMLMSSFHVLHDWTPCGNTANVQKIMI